MGNKENVTENFKSCFSFDKVYIGYFFGKSSV